MQTIKAISHATRISQATILKACQVGRLGERAYRSGYAWLIDTACQQFQQWLAAHHMHALRVKGRLARQQSEQQTGNL